MRGFIHVVIVVCDTIPCQEYCRLRLAQNVYLLVKKLKGQLNSKQGVRDFSNLPYLCFLVSLISGVFDGSTINRRMSLRWKLAGYRGTSSRHCSVACAHKSGARIKLG